MFLKNFFYSSVAMVKMTIMLLVLTSTAQAAVVTISCGHRNNTLQLCYEAAMEWSEKTGNHVEIRSNEQTSLETLGYYQLLLSQGSRDIDIYLIDIIMPEQLALYAIDLAKEMEPAALAKYDPDTISSLTVNGKLVALPYFQDRGFLFYRKDLFKEANIDVPNTWTGWLNAAETVQQHAAIDGFTFQGNLDEGFTCNVLEWLFNDKGLLVAPMVQLNMFKEKLPKITSNSVWGHRAGESVSLFATGEAAIMRNWSYAWGLIKQANPSFIKNVGVAVPPGGGVLGGWSMMVSQHSRNQKLAVDLVKYITGEQWQRRRAEAIALVPAMPHLLADPDLQQYSPLYKLISDQRSINRPANQPDYAKWSNQLSESTYQYLRDRNNGEALPVLFNRLKEQR